jgi:hypothetical protein
MAYVLTTFFGMGFGYAVTATSLGRPVNRRLLTQCGLGKFTRFNPRGDPKLMNFRLM